VVSFRLATSVVTLVLFLTTSTMLSEALADPDFQVGEIKWLQDRYVSTDKATAQLIDPDLNQDSGLIENISVLIWSNTSVPGIYVNLFETDVDTGVFENSTTFTEDQYSNQSNNMLRVTIPEDVGVSYEDTTLPVPPYLPSDRLSISDLVYVGDPLPVSTKRMLLHNPGILDDSSNETTIIKQNKYFSIFVYVQNNSVQHETYFLVFDIFDSKGEKIKTLSGRDSNLPGDNTYGALGETLEKSGSYQVEISVFDFNDKNTMLSPPVRVDFTVIDEINEFKDHTTYNPANNSVQKPILSFVDPEKEPQHYLDRYYKEPKYKEWFDQNYPDYTIEEAVGLPMISEKTIQNDKLPEWVRNIFIWYAEDKISEHELLESIKFLIEYKIIQVDNS
jgi:hypothetical protein